jgi:hypothetical protein
MPNHAISSNVKMRRQTGIACHKYCLLAIRTIIRTNKLTRNSRGKLSDIWHGIVGNVRLQETPSCLNEPWNWIWRKKQTYFAKRNYTLILQFIVATSFYLVCRFILLLSRSIQRDVRTVSAMEIVVMTSILCALLLLSKLGQLFSLPMIHKIGSSAKSVRLRQWQSYTYMHQVAEWGRIVSWKITSMTQGLTRIYKLSNTGLRSKL